MLKIAICDDESFFREKIDSIVTEYLKSKQLQCKVTFYIEGEELCKQRESLREYDIIFLDINMNQLDGIQTAHQIREYNPGVFIVFVTAFMDYVLDGYKVEAVRYILKDSLEVSLIEAMNVIVDKMGNSVSKIKIPIRKGCIEEILLDHILYVESNQHRLIFNMLQEQEEPISYFEKLDTMEKRLQEYGFLRIHKSFLVNMKYITSFSNYKVRLHSKIELPVPKLKYHQIKQAYIAYKGEIW